MTRNEDAAKQFDNVMVQPFRERAVGRKLFAKTYTLNTGKSEISHDVITEMGPAGISFGFKPETVPADSVKVTPTVLKVPTLYNKFTCARDRIEAFLSQGEDLGMEGQKSAYQTMTNLEEDLLIQGWTADGSTYDVNGLYQAAGTTEGTSSVTSTFGNTIIKVRLALAALNVYNADNFDFNMVLSPGNYYELTGSINATYGTIGEVGIVKQQLANLSGNPANVGIYMSPNLTANTGIMVPIDPEGSTLDLVISQDLRTIPRNPVYGSGEAEDVEFVVYEKLLPRIKRAYGICTLTAL